MRKSIKRALSSVLGVTTALTTLFQAGGITTIEARAVETNVDKTVKLSPANASVFNDTDGDGFGEFQGFGTSLCWWANRVGYSDELTRLAAEAFYNKETGLGMTIGRYNIGGGDNVGESPEVSVNEKAAFYDTSYEGLTYAGSKMAVSTNTNLANATYSKSDADFGITSGKKVGSFDNIGWINNLDGEVGSGDNLHYIVNAAEDGKYTVKMLFTLAGSNQRGVSIKVTPESAATYEHKEEGNGAENITDISEDEKGLKKLAAIAIKPLFSRAHKKAAQAFPEIEKCVCEYIQNQNALENENCGSIDKAAEPSAAVMANIFSLLSGEEGQKRALSRLGYCLGRYIYLLDAACDLEDDKKTGSYNVLRNIDGDIKEYVSKQFYISINEAAKAFELLNIKKHKSILGNIIYLGLEQTFKKELNK